jgi:hypothetical protein
MTSPGAENRYSLRSFVDFNAMYLASKNLEVSAQVLFPEDYQQMVDVLLVAKSKAGASA